jgi:sialidase-1
VLKNCEPVSPTPPPTPTPLSSEAFIAGEDGYHEYRIPSLVQLATGDLLLFAEGRKFSSSDHDWNDIVMKRSTDSGKIWSKMQILHSESKGSLHVTIGNPAPVVLQGSATGHVVLTGCRNNTDVFQMISTDHGSTWSNVRYFTKEVVPSTAYSHVATGPPGGMQLPSNRMVVCVCYCTGNEPEKCAGESFSYAMYR